MSEDSGFFVGQIGATIRLDTEDDLATLVDATKLEIHYRRPGKVSGAWTATADGTKLVFTTTAATDLPSPGEYTLQAYLEGPGWALHGAKAIMVVGDPV